MGPYREPSEDVEARLDALELGAFKAALARRGRRVRVGVVLTVLGVIAVPAALTSILFPRTPPLPSHAPSTHCETRMISPTVGEPIRMTICR